jgi:hypothetical protein
VTNESDAWGDIGRDYGRGVSSNPWQEDNSADFLSCYWWGGTVPIGNEGWGSIKLNSK